MQIANVGPWSSVVALALWVGCQGAGESSLTADGGGVSFDGSSTVTDSGATRDTASPADLGMSPMPDQGGGEPDAGPSEDVGVDAGSAAYNGSAGCTDGSNPIAEGEQTFMLEGRERRYVLRLPNGYDGAEPWPVVFALHGNGGSASYWDGTSGDRNIRAVLAEEAILVVAEAIEGNWRDYSADRSTWPVRIESELLYFETIIGELRSRMCIDEREMFSMGFSGGGSFSGVLGCRRTDIRAIAVGGSVIYFDEANCVGTPAAWVTIGTGELSDGREAYRDFFRDRAGCDAASVATTPAPCVAYENCADATPVHYCQHPDGHIWPDFGSDAMWTFFDQFVDQE